MPPADAPMPLPKTFHDTDLLQFEPFLTEFVVRKSWQGHNGRKNANIWPKRAVDLIRTDQSAVSGSRPVSSDRPSPVARVAIERFAISTSLHFD